MSHAVSISEALDEAPLGLFHFRAVVTAGVGFFADAYDLFIIGPALVLIEESWHPSSSSVSLLGATSLFAAFFGAVLFGRLADVVGRKRIYGIEAAVMVIGSLASALAPNMGWLLAARFVLGVGIGGDYPVSAVLMAEFANRSNRGRLVGSVFSMQAAGLIAGPVVALTLLGAGVQHDLLWRIMLGIGGAPAAMVIYRRRKMPESPRFVAKVRGQWEQAARDVATFSSGEISVAGLSDVSSKRLGLRAFLTDRRYVRTLIGTAGTWFLVDYAYYGNTISTPRILQTVDHSVSLTSTLAWTLIIFLVAALPGYMLAVQLMDRIGHRLIQVGGFLAMGVTFFAIGAVHSIIAVPGLFLVTYGVSYFFTEFGPNMSTFVLSAELYPVSMRTTGDGISAGVGKLGAFAGVLTFPVLTAMFGLRGTLLVSAGFCAAGAALTLVLPEPARRSLEEVAEDPSESEQAIAPFVLLRQERANRERAEMLAISASVFAASLEADQLLENLTVQARVGLRCDQTVVILVGEDKVASIYTRGISEPQLTEIMGVTEEPVENLNAAAIAEWPSLAGLVDSSVVAVETVRLRRGGKVVVICANKARRQFNNEERSLLRAIAVQGATALDNALLYRDTQHSEAKYRQLVEQLPPVLYSRRQDTIVPTYVSPRIEQFLGIPQEQFLADPWSRVHPGDRERVGHLHSNPIEGDMRTMDEYRMIRTDGEVIWVRDEAVLLPGPPAIVQGLLSDITARHKAEIEVEFLAYHDPLTRLANRRMFNEVLERALAKSRRHRLSIGGSLC